MKGREFGIVVRVSLFQELASHYKYLFHTITQLMHQHLHHNIMALMRKLCN